MGPEFGHNWACRSSRTYNNSLQKLVMPSWLTLFGNGMTSLFNTLRLRQNGRHFEDDIFNCIFLNENIWISIMISPRSVPKGPVNDMPALVQIMACHLDGVKPLSEPMRVSLPMHIHVTLPQWVKYVTLKSSTDKWQNSYLHNSHWRNIIMIHKICE